MPDDIYTPIEHGLHQLQTRIAANSPFALDAGTLAFRLTENIRAARLVGDSENRRADRAGVIHQLDRLSREAIGVAFSSLYGQQAAPASGETRAATPTNSIGEISGDNVKVFQGRDFTITDGNFFRRRDTSES